MVLQVTSAGFEAGKMSKITLNKKVVELKKNENGHERGLHIVILNPITYRVELS